MALYRYSSEDLMKLPKRDLLLEYKQVINGLAKTVSYEKINFYVKYQSDIEKAIMERMN